MEIVPDSEDRPGDPTEGAAFITDDPTWAGLGRGLLLLATLWWAWVATPGSPTARTPTRRRSG